MNYMFVTLWWKIFNWRCGFWIDLNVWNTNIKLWARLNIYISLFLSWTYYLTNLCTGIQERRGESQRKKEKFKVCGVLWTSISLSFYHELTILQIYVQESKKEGEKVKEKKKSSRSVEFFVLFVIFETLMPENRHVLRCYLMLWRKLCWIMDRTIKNKILLETDTSTARSVISQVNWKK